jgi:multisubunit Na+/H+ antiporter MnhB subunit
MHATTHASTPPDAQRRSWPERLTLTRSSVALAAVAVVGLHVADDAFIQPEPGTSALDHLPGGSVQLAALGLAAFAYRRSRAGVQATIALVAGLLALVIGAASAGYETVTVGPSGDDFTGLLVLPAGLVLIGVGIATLWSSRKLNDRRRRRYTRRVLISAAAAVVAYATVAPLGFSYIITHVMRQTVPAADLGAAHENVSFRTSDGLELQGWYVPSKNGAAVIAFPGRSGSQAHTRMLARHGYGVLLFDRRGEGESEGDSNLLGWGADKDILAAVEYLKTRPDVDSGRIGGLGLSVGGELMLQAAAETDELAAVVSEGAGTRQLSEQLQEFHGLERMLNAPGFLFVTAGTAVFSSTAPPPNLTDVAPKITQPLFVIWAPNGGNIEHMSREYFELASSRSKQIWAMPTAMHVGGIRDQPAEYERRVVGFFDDALLG